MGGACLAVVVAFPSAAGAGPTPDADPGAPRAFILVDVDSGTVLDAKAPHEALAVAGAVKLMTVLTALQRIPLEDRVATTPRAADAPAPRLGMREGTTWASEDLIQATLLSSANDAAYALAEGSAGSLEVFATEMTRVGELMGLQDSTFADAAGLDDEPTLNGASMMSAYDLAVVGANVLAVPELTQIVKLSDYRVITPDGVETALKENVNDFIDTYPDATGMKNGLSLKAGNVLVGSATRDGRSLIAVVLNAEDPKAVASRLLDDGFGTARDAGGTGESIPDARVTTLQGRLVALTGLPRPLGAPGLPTFGEKGPGAPVSEATAPSPKPRNTTASDDGGGGGFPFLKVLGLFAAAGLVVGFVLRQRAVQRDRVRRRIRERALVQAARRGTIDVVDPGEADDPSEVRIVR